MATIGSFGGVLGSASGAPQAQTKGSELERSSQETAKTDLQKERELETEKAAGIGETEEDQQTEERDADGRRLWERTSKPKEPSLDADPALDTDAPQSKDVDGVAGNSLDLTG